MCKQLECAESLDLSNPPNGDFTGIIFPLEVVSACPLCGAPIYGRKQVLQEEPTPRVVFTCSCRSLLVPDENGRSYVS